MIKCQGCGSLITDDKKMCERCFRIINYNEYKSVIKNNSDFKPLLEQISKTKDLILVVVDLFNISDLSLLNEYLNDNVILVLTKRDLLPLSFNDNKLLNYDYKIKTKMRIIISSNKNYHLDELMTLIDKYKTSNKVYLLGFTNSGKSTLVNKLLYNYSTNDTKITTSPLPSTTLDLIELKLNDNLTLIDTPGLLDEGDITNYVDGNILKKIIPTKEIKPLTYQIKGNQTLIIDELVRIDAKDCNITLFISNKLEVNRFYKDTELLVNLPKKEFEVNKDEDIVIPGLGFIRVGCKSKLCIFTLEGVDIKKRKSHI